MKFDAWERFIALRVSFLRATGRELVPGQADGRRRWNPSENENYENENENPGVER